MEAKKIKIVWNHLTDDTYIVKDFETWRDLDWGRPARINEYLGTSDWDNGSIFEWDGAKWVRC